jgi:hypothetical protein
MRHLAPLLFLVLMGLPGCGGPTEVLVGVNAGEPFNLRIGQSAVMREQQLTLRFIQVREDSRCPTDSLILCLWAGRVVLQVNVAPLTGDELPLEVHLGDEPTSAVFGAYRLELLAVTPAARLDPIPAGEYRATFKVMPAR